MAKKYYAVFQGRKPGIYLNWEETKAQVYSFSKPIYKSFTSLLEAENWMSLPKTVDSKKKKSVKTKEQEINTEVEKPSDNSIIIYTDGACKNNPGPGGYGILLLSKSKKKEISGGYRLTTNNRMELLACIIGLEAIIKESVVNIYSDSAYVVNSINKGWAKKWKANGWKRNKNDFADNIDLWERFLNIYDKHKVKMNWVKGHANNPGNEKCDELASNAAVSTDLQIDSAYEKKVKN